MAIVVKDRVKVSTATTGTGTLTLGSAETDFQAFSVIGDGNQTYYAIKSDAGWEVGIGTYTHSGTTLSRDTILESSNSGSAVSLTGTSTVFTTYPAERASFSDQGLSKTYVADGAITAGKPCQFTSAGKAEQIATTTSSNTNSGTYSQGSISKIDDVINDKWSMDVATDGTTYGFAYRETAGQTNFVLGTRSGETITWGTPITLASFNSLTQIVKYNPEQDVFIVTYANQTTHKHLATAVSYSGTTATAGTEIELLASAWTGGGVDQHYTQVYDSNSKNNVFICHGADDALGSKTTAIVITASGTTLTAGSENADTSNGGSYYDGCDLTGGKLLVYYRNYSDSYPYVIVLTVDGNTVTFGTPTSVNSGAGAFCSPVYNPNYTDKAILFGAISTTSNYYSYASLAISGTAITASNFSNGNIASDNCYIESFGKVADYSDYTGEYIAVYADSDDSYKQCNRFCTTTDGVTLTVGSENKDSAGASLFYSSVVSNDVNEKSVAYFGDYTNDDIEYYVVNPTYSFTKTTTTNNFDATKYLGVASTTASDTEEVKINLPEGSINNSQSGLTIGDDYFCNTSGEIKKFITSVTGTNTDPTVKSLTTMDGSDTSTDKVASTYEATSGTYVMAYRDTSNSNYGTLVAGTWSDGTITWGTPYVINSYAIDSNGLDLTSGDGYIALQIYNVGVSTSLRVYSISGTTFTSTEAQTIRNDSPVATGGQKTTWIPSSSLSLTDGGVACGIVFCIYSHAGSGSDETYGRAFAIKSTTGQETGKSTEASFLNTNAHMNRANLVTDPDNAKAIYSTYDGSDGDVGKSFVFGFGGTGSSPTHTVGTGVDFSGADDAPLISSIYDPDNDQVVIVWRNLSGGSTYSIKGCIGTINAGTNAITYSADTTLISTGVNYISQFDITYDQDSNKIIFYYNDGNNSDAFTYKIITSTGSALSIADGAVISTNNCKLQVDSASSGIGVGTMCAVQDGSNSNYVSYTTLYYGTSTTVTQTDAQYIGEAISTTALKLKETPTDIIFGKASNTIAKGNPVLVEADGDFAKVTQTSTTVPEDINLGTPFSKNYYRMSTACKPDGTSVAMAWQGSSYYPTIAVGTVASDGTVTMGTAVTISTTCYGGVDVEYDPDNDLYVMAYAHFNDGTYAVSATYSGTTATLQTAVKLSSTSSYQYHQLLSYDSHNKVFLCALGAGSQSQYMNTFEVSSAGVVTNKTQVTLSGSYQYIHPAFAFDTTNNKFVMVFADGSNGDAMTCCILGDGNAIAIAGTPTVINGTQQSGFKKKGLVYNPVYDNFIFVGSMTATAKLDYQPISVNYSTNAVTAGSIVNINSNQWLWHSDMGNSGKLLAYAPNSKQYYFPAYSTSYSNSPKMFSATTSDGASLTWTMTELSSSQSITAGLVCSAHNTGMFAMSYDSSNYLNYYANAEYTSITNTLTTENFVGLADNASSANGIAKVRINGVDANNSGLSPAEIYYVQEDGTLGLTAVSGKSVEAGKALSATKLLVKG